MAIWRAISALLMMTTVCGDLSAAMFEREADTTTACIWPSWRAVVTGGLGEGRGCRQRAQQGEAQTMAGQGNAVQ